MFRSIFYWLFNFNFSYTIISFFNKENLIETKYFLLEEEHYDLWVPFLKNATVVIVISEIVDILTLSVWTQQNGKKHPNNSSAKVDELFECVWPFCGVGS